MAVLEPEELERSPLADLHALASELGIEGYRRLRRKELIAAILSVEGGEKPPAGATAAPAAAEDAPAVAGEPVQPAEAPAADVPEEEARAAAAAPPPEEAPPEESRSGILDVLPNGSGFVRRDPFAHSPDDVYVSPAQIRRCELRTGDEIEGPVRPPRRSERYPSLVRVETVNGGPAEPPAERPLFRHLTPTFARERLAAPEELEPAPFGKGSRVAVAGPPGAGATTLLRRVASTLSERHPELHLIVVLAGARPEEVPEWRAASTVPVVGGSFDEPAERQADVAAMAVERAKRAAERGGDACLVVDSLDLLPPAMARRVFGTARNTEEAGSITVIAATGIGPEPARHATTRIVLRPPADGGAPQLEPDSSGALRAELLS